MFMYVYVNVNFELLAKVINSDSFIVKVKGRGRLTHCVYLYIVVCIFMYVLTIVIVSSGL